MRNLCIELYGKFVPFFSFRPYWRTCFLFYVHRFQSMYAPFLSITFRLPCGNFVIPSRCASAESSEEKKRCSSFFQRMISSCRWGSFIRSETSDSLSVQDRENMLHAIKYPIQVASSFLSCVDWRIWSRVVLVNRVRICARSTRNKLFQKCSSHIRLLINRQYQARPIELWLRTTV